VLESVRDELAHEVRVVWHEAVGHEMNDNEAVIATTVKFGSDKLDVKRGMPRVVIAEVSYTFKHTAERIARETRKRSGVKLRFTYSELAPSMMAETLTPRA